MNDWTNKLDAFLNINDREILNHAGKISHEVAKKLSEGEYEKHQEERRKLTDSTESDFDKVIKELPKSRKNREDSW